MINLNIFFDLDGTVYEWKEISVNVDSIVDMPLEEKQEYISKEVYKVLKQPGYYKNLKAYPKMLALIKELCVKTQNTNIGIVSCSINDDTTLDKWEALQRDMPFMKKEHVFFLQDGLGKNKAEVIKNAFGKKDGVTFNILIDDHTPNLLEFEKKSDYNIAIKCMNPINGKNGTWKGDIVFYDSDIKENMVLINQAIAKRLEKIQEKQGETEYERDE